MKCEWSDKWMTNKGATERGEESSSSNKNNNKCSAQLKKWNLFAWARGRYESITEKTTTNMLGRSGKNVKLNKARQKPK